MSVHTTEIPGQKKFTSRTPNDQATDKFELGKFGSFIFPQSILKQWTGSVVVLDSNHNLETTFADFYGL